MKISPAGSVALASYLGGPGSERAIKIAITKDERIFLTIRGPVAAGLEKRLVGGCEAPSTIVQIDATAGRVVDYHPLPGVSIPDLALDTAGRPVTLGLWATDSPFAPYYGVDRPLGLAAYDFTRPSKHCVTCLVNAGSMKQGRNSGRGLAVAPGEIVTLMGLGLGPESAAVGLPDRNGGLATELGGTVVKFGGIPVPLLYVQ